MEKEPATFEFIGTLDDITPATDDEELCPSGRRTLPVCCCSAGL